MIDRTKSPEKPKEPTPPREKSAPEEKKKPQKKTSSDNKIFIKFGKTCVLVDKDDKEQIENLKR